MRIRGVLLDTNKCAGVALTKIFGIGQSSASKILQKVGVKSQTRIKDITPAQEDGIRQEIEKKYQTEGELRLEISRHIKRLKEIESYRGLRHSRNLPVRGQRTKTNARTKRGKKVTVGSGRKRSLEKT